MSPSRSRWRSKEGGGEGKADRGPDTLCSPARRSLSPNGGHRTAERAGPFQFPHRRRDLGSLRRKPVQEAFRGVPACEGPGYPSLPGKARGFRGQDTVERHGGLYAALKKINQLAQESPVSNGRGMIDDFRLWGSRPWRRMGEYSTETRLFTGMAHTFDNHDGSLSEGGALAAVVSVLPGKPYWKWVGTDSPRLMRPSEARLRLACPPSTGAAARRTGGVLVVGRRISRPVRPSSRPNRP